MSTRLNSTDFDSIDVSKHSKLRFRQRVDATEPFPAQRIRELLRNATPGAPEADRGLGWTAGDCVIVTDHNRSVVRTVLRREVCE